MAINGETLIEKIKAKRKYADCSAAYSEESSGSSADSLQESAATRKKINEEKCFKSFMPETSCSNSLKETAAARKKNSEDTFLKSLLPETSDSNEDNDVYTSCVEWLNKEENNKIPKFEGPAGPYKTPKLECPAYGSYKTPKLEGPVCGPYTVDYNNQRSELPCDLFFINDKQVLQKVETFNDLSGYLVNSAVKVKDNSSIHHLQKLMKIPVHNSEHYITFGQYLRFLHDHDLFIDVSIDVRGEIFHAHSVALCCHSEYFNRLFAEHPNRKIPFEIKVKGIHPAAFAAILEFFYTGEIIATHETAADILIAADHLKVAALKDRCDVIARSLPLKQSLKVIMQNKLNKSSKLHQTILSNILKDFKSASMQDGFLDMDVDLFCVLIQSDELEVASEYDVFLTAVQWIVYNLAERVRHTVRVMSHVRFVYMTQLELVNCAETSYLVRGYDKFREMILIANWQITAEQLNKDDPFKFERKNPRLCYLRKFQNNHSNATLVMPLPVMTSTPIKKMMSPALSDVRQRHEQHFDILVVGGFVGNCQEVPCKFVKKYDIQDNQWLHFSGLPAPRRHHAVVTIGNTLYLIGGSEPYADNKLPVATNTVFAMDFDTKQWFKVPCMNMYRYSHCACVFNGKIYVFGGKGRKESVLDSMECYDPHTKSWFFGPSLPEPMFAASAASLGNKIYVVGGIGSAKNVPSSLHVLSSVYCFNTTTSSWSTLNELRIPRCHSSLVNVNGRLFLCGGATRSYDVKNSVLHSVAAVDEYHTSEDAWEHAAELTMPRHDAGVAVAGDRIYMIGGISTPEDRALQSIECYDTSKSEWVSGLQDLPYAARWIVSCSIPSKALRLESLD